MSEKRPLSPSHPSVAPPPPETIYVSERRVACDGGGGALGHPIVWYSLEDGRAECMYCDRLFIYDPSKA
ncbi:MAG: zinc-finger domain-containing protein [Pseudomonadota bacterium]